MKKLLSTLLWVSAFSISMGFLETSVVVYLRELYYPKGFDFPLQPIKNNIAVVEFLREAATIIMLAGIGYLAGKTKPARFAWFIYSFAIWDIFYYVFLKLLLGWPASLFTWDILFLIPFPWVGPVLAPCLVSLSMILLAGSILYMEERGMDNRLRFSEKVGLILGCTIIIGSFLWDYLATILSVRTSAWKPTDSGALFSEIATYVPQSYNWWVFWAGELLILAIIYSYVKSRLKPSPFPNYG